MKEKQTKIRPPFKIHGGKFYLSSWVIEHFPEGYEKLDYVEPFCGAASVFMNKKRSEGMEVLNDLDEGVIQIFRALRDEPDHFIKKLKRITYSENVFERELKKSNDKFEDYMDHALNEFIVRRMSRGGLKKAFAWSDRERGGQPGDVNAWKTIVEQLPAIAEKLSNVIILNSNAIKVVQSFDDINTLCYCDPPYLHETRVSTNAYEMEMTTDQHIELAEYLNRFKGKVIVSGYPSTLYNRLFKEWKCIKKKVPNHSSQKKSKSIKTECLWLNY